MCLFVCLFVCLLACACAVFDRVAVQSATVALRMYVEPYKGQSSFVCDYSDSKGLLVASGDVRTLKWLIIRRCRKPCLWH